MNIFQEEVNNKLKEIQDNLNLIKSVEANFYTLSLLEGEDFKKTDRATKMNTKQYGTFFGTIPVYANSGLSHGEVKINYGS